MSKAPQGRKGDAPTLTAVMLCGFLSANSSVAAENFKKPNSAQIRRSFTAMEFTDQVHWVERYRADGTLTTREMGTTRIGTWRVEDDSCAWILGRREVADVMKSGCPVAKLS
jgi:hypothetical protein